jgi:hypothetical protein
MGHCVRWNTRLICFTRRLGNNLHRFFFVVWWVFFPEKRTKSWTEKGGQPKNEMLRIDDVFELINLSSLCFGPTYKIAYIKSPWLIVFAFLFRRNIYLNAKNEERQRNHWQRHQINSNESNFLFSHCDSSPNKVHLQKSSN